MLRFNIKKLIQAAIALIFLHFSSISSGHELVEMISKELTSNGYENENLEVLKEYNRNLTNPLLKESNNLFSYDVNITGDSYLFSYTVNSENYKCILNLDIDNQSNIKHLEIHNISIDNWPEILPCFKDNISNYKKIN